MPLTECARVEAAPDAAGVVQLVLRQEDGRHRETAKMNGEQARREMMTLLAAYLAGDAGIGDFAGWEAGLSLDPAVAGQLRGILDRLALVAGGGRGRVARRARVPRAGGGCDAARSVGEPQRRALQHNPQAMRRR